MRKRKKVKQMKLKYLLNIETLEDLKKTYRATALKLHPDVGGSDEQMQELNNEYEYLFDEVTKDEQAKAKGSIKWRETAQTYPDIISKIIFYKDINIEIVGSWIWVDGNTLPYKDELKALSFLWSKARKKWYYTPTISIGKKMMYKREKFDTLRSRYGSNRVHTERLNELE